MLTLLVMATIGLHPLKCEVIPEADLRVTQMSETYSEMNKEFNNRFFKMTDLGSFYDLQFYIADYMKTSKDKNIAYYDLLLTIVQCINRVCADKTIEDNSKIGMNNVLIQFLNMLGTYPNNDKIDTTHIIEKLFENESLDEILISHIMQIDETYLSLIASDYAGISKYEKYIESKENKKVLRYLFEENPETIYYYFQKNKFSYDENKDNYQLSKYLETIFTIRWGMNVDKVISVPDWDSKLNDFYDKLKSTNHWSSDVILAVYAKDFDNKDLREYVMGNLSSHDEKEKELILDILKKKPHKDVLPVK